MGDDKIEVFPETYELAFVVGKNGNLVSYDYDRWHAVIMRQESDLDFANTTQQFIHVYFRKAFGSEKFHIEGIDAGEYQFLSDGCRKKTPEDLAVNLMMRKVIDDAVGLEANTADPNVVLAEDQFVNKALENSTPLWQPTDDQMEQVSFWITMFFEQEDADENESLDSEGGENW